VPATSVLLVCHMQQSLIGQLGFATMLMVGCARDGGSIPFAELLEELNH
jgi:hypothetical protein